MPGLAGNWSGGRAPGNRRGPCDRARAVCSCGESSLGSPGWEMSGLNQPGTVLGEAIEVRVFEIGDDRLRAVGWSVAEQAGVNAVAAAGGVADEITLARRVQIGAGENPLPDFAFDFLQERFRRSVSYERALRDQGDVGGGGFDVGNDVGGEDNDAFARKFREQVAKAHAFFGIESGGRLVNDEQLRIV